LKDKRQCSDAETWRTLTEGFIYYLRDLDITDTYPRGSWRDDANIQRLRSTENMGHKIAKASRFLLDIRPPDDKLYTCGWGAPEKDESKHED
jgi:hypothetical protein